MNLKPFIVPNFREPQASFGLCARLNYSLWSEEIRVRRVGPPERSLLTRRGYLHALNSPNVTTVWDTLVSATEDQVTTSEGRRITHSELMTGRNFSPDVVALATGFDVVRGDVPCQSSRTG